MKIDRTTVFARPLVQADFLLIVCQLVILSTIWKLSNMRNVADET